MTFYWKRTKWWMEFFIRWECEWNKLAHKICSFIQSMWWMLNLFPGNSMNVTCWKVIRKALWAFLPWYVRNLHSNVSYLQNFLLLLQYRFTSRWDIFLLIVGVIFTFVKSCSLPIFLITFGEATTLLVDRTSGTGQSSSTYILKLFGGGKIL